LYFFKYLFIFGENYEDAPPPQRNLYLLIAFVLLFSSIEMSYALTPLPPCAHTGQTPAPPNISTPSPCMVGSQQQQGWSGPCYYRICSDTVQGLGGIQEPKCCYWVVYYQRIIPNSAQLGYELYETNVTGIFYDGEDCELRSRGQIIHAFQNALYKKLDNDDPTFFDDHYMPSDGDSGVASQYFYTTGGCFEEDSNGDVVYDEFGKPVNCDSDDYCCQYTKQVHYKKNYLGETKIWRIDSLNSENPNPVFEVTKNGDDALCSGSCKWACDNVLMEDAATILCDEPCNDADWSNLIEKQVPIPGCSPCEVTVKFRKRTSSPCPQYGMESANDIYLHSFEWVDDTLAPPTPCTSCTLDVHGMHSAVVDYLLKNEFDNKPPNNQCKNYYRLMQSACWFDHLRPEYTAYERYYPPTRVMRACGEESCCVQHYRLCANMNGVITYQLLSSEAESIDCHVYPWPCVFICEPTE